MLFGCPVQRNILSLLFIYHLNQVVTRTFRKVISSAMPTDDAIPKVGAANTLGWNLAMWLCEITDRLIVNSQNNDIFGKIQCALSIF